MNTNSKLTHRLRLTAVILFFFILWIPLLQMLHPILPEMKSTENRKLAERPEIKLNLRALKNYTKQLNRYLDDHYGLRNAIIRLNGMIHVNLLHTSPTRDVVLGREGWLYYDRSADGISLADYCGKAPWTETELKLVAENVIRIKRFCEERGTLFKIVIAPNKHTIYPEFLPLDIKNSQGVSTRLDQLRNFLISNGLGSVLIDLRPALVLSKGKSPDPLYYLTDTHWNQLGAFIAYTEIMKNLITAFPQIKILDIKKYHVARKENRGLGDLSTFISMWGLLKDTEIVLEPQTPYLAKKIDSGIELKGTYHIERYRIEKCDYAKLLMFPDSFGVSLVPYLSESFSDSLYIWHTPPGVDLPIIEKERPQIVILQLVERNLQYLSKPFPFAFGKTQAKS